MKKLFTILCAGVLSLGVSAQTQFGVTAGLNMANLSASEKYDEIDGLKMGVHVGISADVLLSDAMSLKTGAFFSMKGAEETIDVPFLGPVTGTYRLSYIEIPMDLSFAVSDQMSLIAGPYMGFLMGAELEFSGAGAIAANNAGKFDIEDNVASMDFGINLGASFAVTEVISINAGYQIGLTELDVDGNVDSKNTNIHIGMTFAFGS